MVKTGIKNPTVPYRFKSHEEAVAAMNAVNAKFTNGFKSHEEAVAAMNAVNDKFTKKTNGTDATKQVFYTEREAYCTERIVYVPEHKSMLFNLSVEDFVISLGGTRHTD